ncbi:MAG: hypothetical protein ACI9R3_005212 [Verrucomicrobiales bacterium]|jgi:hypothetical protein
MTRSIVRGTCSDFEWVQIGCSSLDEVRSAGNPVEHPLSCCSDKHIKIYPDTGFSNAAYFKEILAQVHTTFLKFVSLRHYTRKHEKLASEKRVLPFREKVGVTLLRLRDGGENPSVRGERAPHQHQHP